MRPVWELVSPRRPFEGMHPGEIIHQVVTKNLRPAPWSPGVPQVTQGGHGSAGVEEQRREGKPQKTVAWAGGWGAKGGARGGRGREAKEEGG